MQLYLEAYGCVICNTSRMTKPAASQASQMTNNYSHFCSVWFVKQSKTSALLFCDSILQTTQQEGRRAPGIPVSALCFLLPACLIHSPLPQFPAPPGGCTSILKSGGELCAARVENHQALGFNMAATHPGSIILQMCDPGQRTWLL